MKQFSLPVPAMGDVQYFICLKVFQNLIDSSKPSKGWNCERNKITSHAGKAGEV